MIKQIKKRIEELKKEYDYVGVRRSDEDNETIESRSTIWDDGEKTDEELIGLCTIDSDGNWIEAHIEKNYSANVHWYGCFEHIYIVAGNKCENGNDPDEIIIEPEIVELIK